MRNSRHQLPEPTAIENRILAGGGVDYRRYDEFKSRGVVLLAICNDAPPRLERFSTELELRFPILYDLGGRVAACYGAYAMKVHQGRSYRGLIRSTFLIDRKGICIKAWNRVHVRGHATHVVAALEQLTL